MELGVMKQEEVVRALGVRGENFRAAYVLSVILATLAAITSAAGLAYPAVYRDKSAIPMAFANDLATLVVAVPVLVGALILSARGSLRARLVWLGSLYYMLYNYAFYVFALQVTALYLPLIAAFTLSGFALALGLGNLDVESAARKFSARTPARCIAVYMVVWAAGVGRLWISQWIKFLTTGVVPTVNGDANGYRTIAAVDLSFMVSLLIPAAYWLWRRRPWGFVLAVMLFVQGTIYLAMLAGASVASWMAAPGTNLWSGWLISCMVNWPIAALCLFGLLVNIKRPELQR